MRNDLIKGITKLSSGNLFLSVVCSVGVEVQQRIKNNTENVIQEEKSQFNKARATYLGLFLEANAICQNKPDWRTWNGKELTAVLNTMKRKTDSSLPKKKAELAALFKEWNINCSPFTFREYCSMNNKAIPTGKSTNLN